ncbi:class I adenylate-forming enzyme family protein [Rhodococcus ruber]|uniref:AMP-dependent synthetase and ligase n=1 Tax=Rhodococcus ruber TaxID=1830 RepID=A0A098BUU6_9NOCA|nr:MULTISPECIES: class I adenylate-forming enzyme family protein [Rhodococcus]AXY51395.1 AMP-dependent synthetase and ligase [Rhodococcus ruber]MBD8055756.1 acyl--CoA ligase [Rhodococcus ruber]MCD2128709.1 acyl--CoA ligase [Rhodococcus ruber]MCZ4505682.1 class I adenylate-forming enzyme family protein [Rhodococcus ruber]MCZ4532397.1 class I adenylate-forming enzyme family protein [Rhodococcus ruber]
MIDQPHPDPGTPSTSLWDVFAGRAAAHPDREAVVHGPFRCTYGELREQAERTAAGLEALGVRAGDRVGMLSYPRPEVVAVYLACARLGAIFLGIGTRVNDKELDYILTDATPSVLVTVDRFEGTQFGALVDRAAERHDIRAVVHLGDEPGGPLPFEVAPARSVVRPVDPDAPLSIVYTSGTTGDPKGAVVTHRGILTFSALLRHTPVEAPRILSLMPIDHIGGQGNEIVSAILSGGTLVQLPRFDAGAALTAIEQEKVTLWQGVIQTMLNRLMAHDRFETADLGSLERLWWVGPLPVSLAERLAARIPVVGASYGMTEVGCITMTDRDITPADATRTVGKPLDDVDIRIEPIPGHHTGEPGEILVRRNPLMQGYWRKPEKTAEAITPTGWLRTGDLGYFDDSGNLVLAGRSKLLIRSGGYNISPMEIEQIVENHPGIQLAAVAAVPDPDLGEAAHMLAIPAPGHAPTEDDVKKFLRERLSSYKIPKSVRFCDRIPLLANSKLDRRGVQQMLDPRADTPAPVPSQEER